MSLTFIWGGGEVQIGGVNFSSEGEKIEKLVGVKTYNFNQVSTGYGELVGYEREDKPNIQDLSVEWNAPNDAFIVIPERFLVVLTLPYILEGLIGQLGRSHLSRNPNELWALSFENNNGGQLGATHMDANTTQILGLYGMVKAS